MEAGTLIGLLLIYISLVFVVHVIMSNDIIGWWSSKYPILFLLSIIIGGPLVWLWYGMTYLSVFLYKHEVFYDS